MWNTKSLEQRRTRKPSWPACCNGSLLALRSSTPAPEPDRALRLEEAASLLAMSQDFVYRHWRRLGGYKDTDHHIKFRMSDLQRHLQRKAPNRGSGQLVLGPLYSRQAA